MDVCLVKPVNQEVLCEVNRSLGGKYDIAIFERLPLYMQMEIISNYRIVYGEENEISAYFYKKLWKDMVFRIRLNEFSNVHERMVLRRRWLHKKRKILKRS